MKAVVNVPSLGIIRPSEETTPLLNHNKLKVGEGKVVKTLHFIKLVEAPLDGIAKTYSTVRLIALTFFQPSLYILIPLAIGGAINLGAELFPPKEGEEGKVGLAKNTLHMMNEVGIELLEDFGFFWETLVWVDKSLGLDITLPNYALPLLSIGPACFSRFIKYRHHRRDEVHKHEAHSSPRASPPAPRSWLDNRAFKVVAEGIAAAASSAYFMGLLERQEIISEESPIPLILISVSGIFGVVCELIKPYAPRLSKVGALSIELLQKLSLAAAFLDIPFSIYAAIEILRHKEPIIPSAFEWPMFILTAIYGAIIILPLFVKFIRILATIPLIQKNIPLIPYLAQLLTFSEPVIKEREEEGTGPINTHLADIEQGFLANTPPSSPRERVAKEDESEVDFIKESGAMTEAEGGSDSNLVLV